MQVDEAQQQPVVGLARTEHAQVGQHLHVDQTGGAEQRGQPPADPDVTAPRPPGRVGEPVPVGVLRKARPGHPVDVLQRDVAARSGQAHHLGDHRLGIRHVVQDQALVHQVERRRRQAGRRRVPLVQCDGPEPAHVQLPARDRQVPGLAVEPDHVPARADALGQQVEDAERAAAEVERPVPGPDADPVESTPASARCVAHCASSRARSASSTPSE